MIRVLTFGTFDVLHPGHVFYLTQAQNLGDELHICIARDLTVERIKGKPARESEQKRMEKVQEYFPDAYLYLGDLYNVYAILDKVKPTKIALGYDQNSFTDKLEDELKLRGLSTDIIRLGDFYPHMYKSTLFRTQQSIQKNRHGE